MKKTHRLQQHQSNDDEEPPTKKQRRPYKKGNSSSYGSRTTIVEVGLKRRSCICMNKECNTIMTKWAKVSPHNYHHVQLPKLVVAGSTGSASAAVNEW